MSKDIKSFFLKCWKKEEKKAKIFKRKLQLFSHVLRFSVSHMKDLYMVFFLSNYWLAKTYLTILTCSIVWQPLLLVLLASAFICFKTTVGKVWLLDLLWIMRELAGHIWIPLLNNLQVLFDRFLQWWDRLSHPKTV